MKTSLALFAVLCAMSSLQAREWTNTAGRKIEADLVEVKKGPQGDVAVLKLATGQTHDIPLSTLSAADQQFARTAATTTPAGEKPAAGAAESTFGALLKGKLVALENRKPAPYEITTNPEYYAIYFSASWCGPCRAFTPELVKFHRSSSKKDKFEVILVSSDKSAEAMADYMKEDRMAWPALKYDERNSISQISKLSGTGIPCLVVVDREGKVVSHSYVDGKYVGPRQVLEDLKDKLKEKP